MPKFLLIFFFFAQTIWAQQLPTVEELTLELMAGEIDTNRVKNLARLTQLIYESEPEKAIAYIEEAVTLSETLDYQYGLRVSYNLLGTIYCNWGDYDLGVDFYFKSLKIGEELNDHDGINTVHANLGKAFWEIGELDKAIEYQEKSLQGCKELQDKKGIASAHLNLGTIYSAQGKNEKAEKAFSRAKVMAHEIQAVTIEAIAYNNIAWTKCERGEYESATEEVLTGLKIAEKKGDAYYIIPFYMTLGEINFATKNYKICLEHLQVARTIAEEHGYKRVLPDLYLKMSNCYKALDDIEQQFDYYTLYAASKDSLYNDAKIQGTKRLEARYKNEKRLKEIELLQKDKAYRQSVMIGVVITSVLIIIVLILVFFQQRLRTQHQKTELNRKALELEHRLLRLQINPHFIFNALNSIQKFFVQGDEANVYQSIGDFSALMRGVLENSDKTFVSIAEELKVLELYVKIEQLRVKNRFDVEFSIAPDIDVHQTEVPSMLLQPYVENAIWHGLMHREDGGKVVIEVKRAARYLQFTVEDNGVGREKTKNMQQKHPKTHQSKGLQLMEDRVQVINRMRDLDLSITIQDLYDNAQATGTRVCIQMKMD